MVKIDMKGKVRAGQYANWFVLVEQHRDMVGGVPTDSYYLFLGKDDPRRGYDSFYPTLGDVEVVLAEMDVEWLDP